MALFNSQWATALVELPTLTFHHALLPLSIFSALHGIRISMAYRQAIQHAAEQSLKDGTVPKPARVPWGQALVSVLAMALGGGFSASMLLGMPPSWLGSNVVVPTYALSFFLVHYTFLYDVLKDMVPAAVLDPILIVADGSLRALSIAKLGVDGSRMRFAADSHQGGAGIVSEPWFAMMLLGVIAGSGGGMLADLLKLKGHQWTLCTPTFVHSATYDMKAALLSAFFYAASTSPQFYSLLRQEETLEYGQGKGSLLESQDAKAMTMLLMCTLLLGQRAEPAILQLTGISVSPVAWINSLQTKMAVSLKRNDGGEREEVQLEKIDKDDETAYRPLRRRGRRAAGSIEETADEADEEDKDEEEEEPVKRSSRGGKKKATGTKAVSPAPTPAVAAETPLTRNSTRVRKPARKDL
ncbi:hypothetical protein EDD21DRAFT_383342 [Dissophora ornata]|nr:hypothetical protein BGZ58_009194 [Dissophora ornata]KAI8598148.1 hypothetical protein EDD21DRAFT_383342 [Dissophora ornata]